MEGKKLKERKLERKREEKRKQRQKKQKQLGWRILGNISLILALSMIISTAVGYCYFMEVVRRQKISDERSRLVQVSNQITFMTEDIRRFAESILIDEELQNLLEEDVSNEFLRQNRYDKVAKRLVFYNNLRTYISSSVLKMADGTYFGSSYNAMDTEYIAQKLQEKGIAEYESGYYVYSDPYYGTDDQTGDAYICYRVKMYDKYHYGRFKATLYLEIRLDYFLDQVRSYGDAYDYVCLFGNRQKILYEQDKNGVLQESLEKQTPKTTGIYKVTGGYLICDSIDAAGWTLCTLITNRYLFERSKFVLEFFILSFLASVGLILIFTSRRVGNMIRPVAELSEKMEKIAGGDVEPIEIVHTGDEIETLYECFDHMLQELAKSEQARIEFEKQKRDMEYDIMLSQINPHYIYNVLNTVVYLAAAGKNKDVVRIVHSLIYTLHDTLNIGEGSVETSIEKELELTRCYLDIQKYRYPSMFEVRISCEQGLEQCLIPKTIIQPLVENAILHGILPTEREGIVKVEITEENGRLKIQVLDNGMGISQKRLEQFQRGEEMASEKKERKHIGVNNVRDRIRYLYGEGYGMEITSQKGQGTGILLTLPVKRQQDGMETKTASETKAVSEQDMGKETQL